MLVLTRKQGQTFLIGDNVEVTVLEVGGDKVRIAIDAPREVSILRKELVEAKAANQAARVREPLRPTELCDLKSVLSAGVNPRRK